MIKRKGQERKNPEARERQRFSSEEQLQELNVSLALASADTKSGWRSLPYWVPMNDIMNHVRWGNSATCFLRGLFVQNSRRSNV